MSFPHSAIQDDVTTMPLRASSDVSWWDTAREQKESQDSDEVADVPPISEPVDAIILPDEPEDAADLPGSDPVADAKTEVTARARTRATARPISGAPAPPAARATSTARTARVSPTAPVSPARPEPPREDTVRLRASSPRAVVRSRPVSVEPSTRPTHRTAPAHRPDNRTVRLGAGTRSSARSGSHTGVRAGAHASGTVPSSSLRPSREDHERFCRTEGWQLVPGPRGGHTEPSTATYELTLADGRVLRTRIAHWANRPEYGPKLWEHILTEQLSVSEEEFWACVRNGVAPHRGAPATPSDALPAELVHLLTSRVGLSDAEVAAMSKYEAVARMQLYWIDGI